MATASGISSCGFMSSKHVTVLIVFLLSAIGAISCHGGADKEHRLHAEEGNIICTESERRALLAIKSDMYDPGEWFSSWIGEDCCDGWRGVACDDATGHVTELDLRYPYLYPMGASKVNPALLDLKHLNYLDLSMNDFSGAPIPKMIASLQRLEYLNLSSASFSGLIPPQLENLSSLHHLDLGGYADVPLRADDLDWLSHFPSLKYLDLTHVNLSKVTSWLHQINSVPTLEVLLLGWASLPYVPSPLLPFNLTSITMLDLSAYSSFTSAMLRWLSNASKLEYLHLYFSDGIDVEPLEVALGAFSYLKELDLTGCGIEGEISRIVRNVSRSLKLLDLGRNFLTGDIPPTLWSLRHLEYLSLEGTPVTGYIPEMLGNLTSLRHLSLSSTNIAGEIPRFVGNVVHLEFLDLSSTQIAGEIPQSVGNLVHLEFLDLSYTQIAEEIPQTVGNLVHLVHLDLSYTQIAREIPPTVGNLVHLEFLDLSSTQIVGEIPPTVGNLIHLEFLDLSKYHIVGEMPLTEYVTKYRGPLGATEMAGLDLSGNVISGEIPESFGNLVNLEKLYLSANNISGQVPENIGNLQNLSFLYLDDNSITGQIPETIGKLYKLRKLDISNNQLSGQIPVTFGNLQNLQYLSLEDNSIIGQIPETIGKLYNLRELDISNNQLTGQIPRTMGGLCNLTSTDLSHNNIGGELIDLIDGLSNCTQGASLSSLKIKGNNLSGIIPSSLGLLSELRTLNLSSNSLEGNMTEAHFSKLTNLGVLDISYNSLNVVLSNDWLPPFHASVIDMSLCHLGTSFPIWIQTQTDLKLLSLNGVGLWGSIVSHSLPLSPSDHSNISFLIPIPLSLVVLSLSDNHINGSFPSFFCNMTSLEVLVLSNNNLSGEFPNCRIAFPTSLKSLHLNNNGLSGRFPSFLEHCKDLSILDLGDNKLLGEIPSWVGRNLSSLKVLRLRSNQLYGAIPMSITYLTSLRVLDLSFNNLFGCIPSSLGNFSAMIAIQNYTKQSKFGKPYTRSCRSPYMCTSGGINYFNYYYNESILITTKGLTIPYTTILSLVTSIDLSNNNLSDEIPKELTNLLGLHSLNLSKNHLSGRIPENIGAMKQLESLDLSINNLAGEIPSSLSTLTFLSHLNLSYNNLSGRIPTGNQMWTFNDSSVYVGNKDLCGMPLPECPGGGAYQSPPHAGEQREEDDDDKLETLLVYTSIIMGFVVGFWVSIGIMIMKRAIRVAFFRLIDKTCDWIYVQFVVTFGKLKSTWQ